MVDVIWQYLLDGDFIGFLVAVYTSQIGEFFFPLLTMIVTGVLYMRTQSLLFVSIIWIAVGGLFIGTMPVVSPIAVLMLGFGIAGALFQLFTALR